MAQKPQRPRATTGEERQHLIREWEDTPSPNPRYGGLTLREVARALGYSNGRPVTPDPSDG